ncbi:MAG: Fe(3+) ABC transporter substrate-binding protein [Sphingomonadales bacterium]
MSAVKRSLPATLIIAFCLTAIAVAAALYFPREPQIVEAINVYTSRHYDTDMALYDDFTKQTGVKVNFLEAPADSLIERIKKEGKYSPGDILITVDAGRLWPAEQAGILAPVSSDVLTTRVPENLRHGDGLWFALSKRARVIIYNKAAGKPEGLNRYEDLANPVFKGQVCIRSSSNIYNTSLMAALVSHLGAKATQKWAQAVVANFARKPQGNDISHIRAVAIGECRIAVINTYYLARLASSQNPDEAALADQVGLIFPNQDSFGTHVNISGGGILKHAPNRENAVKFLEYLTSSSAQAYFANGNNEYPIIPDVAPTAAIAKLGTFKEDTLSAEALGSNQAEAIRIFDRVGWP